MNPHPFAKVFAPVVFLTLALLSVGISFGSAEEPTSAAAATATAKTSQ